MWISGSKVMGQSINLDWWIISKVGAFENVGTFFTQQDQSYIWMFGFWESLIRVLVDDLSGNRKVLYSPSHAVKGTTISASAVGDITP